MILGANTTITTYRLVDTGSTTDHSASATVSGAEAYIEAASAELVAVLGQQPGIEVYMCYVEPGNYRENDKVVDSQGNEYTIVGIERRENNVDTDDIYAMRLNKATTFYNA